MDQVVKGETHLFEKLFSNTGTVGLEHHTEIVAGCSQMIAGQKFEVGRDAIRLDGMLARNLEVTVCVANVHSRDVMYCWGEDTMCRRC